MRERLAGLGFLAVLVALLGLCVGAYAKVFTPVVAVTVLADHTGMQLNEGADVKLHGVLVGEVRDISSTGDGAQLGLALDPVAQPSIPADVSARLLPKTLFGEKYVELVDAESSSRTPITAGTVIEVDRSQQAVELEEVLDGALPLLRAVPPEKLAITLSSIADALAGRGDELGETVVQLGDVLHQLNEEMPTISADIDELAAVLDTYHGALPDLLAVLENLSVTNRTVADQSDQLKAVWMTSQDFGDRTRVFLDRYEGRLVQFGEVTEPFLELLAAYSPEYPCLFQGLSAVKPNIEEAFAGGRLHITLEITSNNGKYQYGDEPEWLAHTGPDCRGLPSPEVPGPQRVFGNGYQYADSRVNLPIEIPGLTDFTQNVSDDPEAGQVTDDESEEPTGPQLPFDPRMGYAGTEAEQDIVTPLVAASTGVGAADVPDWATLLWGPILRGVTVSVR